MSGKCRSITGAGTRCTREAKGPIAGFCTQHKNCPPERAFPEDTPAQFGVGLPVISTSSSRSTQQIQKPTITPIIPGLNTAPLIPQHYFISSKPISTLPPLKPITSLPPLGQTLSVSQPLIQTLPPLGQTLSVSKPPIQSQIQPPNQPLIQPQIQLEDPGSTIKVYPTEQNIDFIKSATIGPYDKSLKVWRENPAVPSPTYLQEQITDTYPNSIFLEYQYDVVKNKERDDTGTPPFYHGRKYPRLHWGQRKLLLSEIQFFNFFLKSNAESGLIVYAGAAAGTHILCLLQLFPGLKFDLYDPSKFDEELVTYSKTPETRVRIFTGKDGFFTNEIAASYNDEKSENYQRTIESKIVNETEIKTRLNLFFVSDIRTNIAMTEDPNDPNAKARQYMKQVRIEMEMQKEWSRTLNGYASIFKFKLAYPLVGDKAFEEYCDGTMFFQAWAPVPSSETRLMSDNKQLNTDIYYNIPFYGAKVDYFNAAMRTTDFSKVTLYEILNKLGLETKNREENKLINMKTIWEDVKLEILTIDAFLELTIWIRYLVLSDSDITIDNLKQLIFFSTSIISPFERKRLSDGKMTIAQVFDKHLKPSVFTIQKVSSVAQPSISSSSPSIYEQIRKEFKEKTTQSPYQTSYSEQGQYQIPVQPIQYQIPVQPIQYQIPVQPIQYQVPIQTGTYQYQQPTYQQLPVQTNMYQYQQPTYQQPPNRGRGERGRGRGRGRGSFERGRGRGRGRGGSTYVPREEIQQARSPYSESGGSEFSEYEYVQDQSE